MELARFYNKSAADELVLLDIAASYEGRKTTMEVVEKTVREISIPLTVGGGIRSIEHIRHIFEAGADKISMSTPAVENPKLIEEAARIFIVRALLWRSMRFGTRRWKTGRYILIGPEGYGISVLSGPRVEDLGAEKYY